jgi:ribosome-binding ATPase YchF (GTP1/OBG family)
MKIAILGSLDSGKNSLFEILTEGKLSKIGNKIVGNANVSDSRVDYLSNHFHPKKTTYTQLNFISLDLEPIFPAEELKVADEIVYVMRSFPDYEGEEVDLIKQYDDFDTSLRIKDMDLLEKFIERNHKDTKRTQEIEIAKHILALIENGTSVQTKDIENEMVKNFSLISIIPKMVVCNISENQLHDKKLTDEIQKKYPDLKIMPVCLSVEQELVSMDVESRKEMLEAYSIEIRALDLFILKSYEMLGLITFFTVGEDEVRAWTVKKGNNAFVAAGKIHTDIQRGFIRAEIVHYQDFISHNCSFKEVKEKGVFHLEGKEYIVQDGDIMHVRFNI